MTNQPKNRDLYPVVPSDPDYSAETVRNRVNAFLGPVLGRMTDAEKHRLPTDTSGYVDGIVGQALAEIEKESL